jgi:hypothetical protein
LCDWAQAKSKELHQCLTESAILLSGASLLKAEAAAALAQPELGLLKLKRSLDRLSTCVKASDASVNESVEVLDLRERTDLDSEELIASIRTFGAVGARCTFLGGRRTRKGHAL